MVHVDTMVTAAAGTLLVGLAYNAPLASAVVDPAIHERAMRALVSSSSGVSNSACFDEGTACAMDDDCLGCNELYATQSEACSEAIVTPTVDADICEVLEELLCCSTDSCWDNKAYADLIECAQLDAENGFGCSAIDIGVCSGAGGGGGGGVVTETDDDAPAATSDRGPPTTVDSSTTAVSGDDSSTTPTDGGTGPGRGPGVTTTDSTTTLGDDASLTTTSDRGVPVDDTTLTTTSDGGVPVDDTTLTTTSDRGVPVDSSTTEESPSSTTTAVCEAEQAACVADPDCVACGEAVGKTSEAAEATCQEAGYDADTATCDERFEVGCCSVGEGAECLATNSVMAAWVDCLVEADGCDFSVTDCAVSGDSPAGGDDETSDTASDRDVAPVDSTTTATDATEDSSESLPFLGGDDEGQAADGVEVDDDEDEEGVDADAADTDTDSADPSAVAGGATAVLAASAVSLALMMAA